MCQTCLWQGLSRWKPISSYLRSLYELPIVLASKRSRLIFQRSRNKKPDGNTYTIGFQLVFFFFIEFWKLFPLCALLVYLRVRIEMQMIWLKVPLFMNSNVFVYWVWYTYWIHYIIFYTFLRTLVYLWENGSS